MSRALVVLPLTLAVLLVSLCIPMTCSAQLMAKECGPATMPRRHQAPSPAGDPVCKHATANVQAVNPDQQVHVAQAVAALPFVAPALPVSKPLTTVVDRSPAKPPGLVLTVSQLRI
jgi:hypothetical protein